MRTLGLLLFPGRAGLATKSAHPPAPPTGVFFSFVWVLLLVVAGAAVVAAAVVFAFLVDAAMEAPGEVIVAVADTYNAGSRATAVAAAAAGA